MSDSNPLTGAAQDLGVPESPPSVPPMPYAEAVSRKAEMLASEEIRNKIMSGDADANREWKRVVEGLSAIPPTTTGARDDLAAHIQECSGHSLSPEHLQEIRDNPPITPDERRQTEALWNDRQHDPEWRARLNRGEVKARRELSLIQFMLSRPVRQPQN